jgi:hypothetical protein
MTTRYTADFRVGAHGLVHAEIDASSDHEAFRDALLTNSAREGHQMLRIVRDNGDGNGVVVWCDYLGSHLHQVELWTDELWHSGVAAAKASYGTEPEAQASSPTLG